MVRLRQGNKVKKNIYLQLHDAPGLHDMPVGQLCDEQIAFEICYRFNCYEMNREIELTQMGPDRERD